MGQIWQFLHVGWKNMHNSCSKYTRSLFRLRDRDFLFYRSGNKWSSKCVKCMWTIKKYKKDGQFGTADNLAPQWKTDNLAPSCKTDNLAPGQFGTAIKNGQFGTAVKNGQFVTAMKNGQFGTTMKNGQFGTKNNKQSSVNRETVLFSGFTYIQWQCLHC